MSISSRNLSCCLCEDSVSRHFRIVDSHELVRCEGCGLIHIKQVTSNAKDFLEDVISENVGKLEYWGYPEVFTKHEHVFNFFFVERYQRIKKNLKIDGPWLDVGSGYGLWQKFLNARKQPNMGIEIENKAYLYTKQAGLDVLLISIEEFKTDRKFAVITMCDVLEHVENPLEVVRKCYDLLMPGGLLYLQVPCVLGARYPYRDTLGLPHHLWQFEPQTLKTLVKKAGLEVISLWTGVQGVIKYYERGKPSLLRKILWSIARLCKRGNRLQLLVKK